MAAAVVNIFTTDTWKADAYESLSLAARLSMLVKGVRTHSQNLKMSYWLWKINGQAAKFFTKVDDILAAPPTQSANSPELPSSETFQKSVDILMQLGMSFKEVYEEARRRRFLNNSLIAGPVTALHSNADQFFELAEWLEMMKDPNHIDAVFAKANEQRKNGEVYSLAEV